MTRVQLIDWLVRKLARTGSKVGLVLQIQVLGADAHADGGFVLVEARVGGDAAGNGAGGQGRVAVRRHRDRIDALAQEGQRARGVLDVVLHGSVRPADRAAGYLSWR